MTTQICSFVAFVVLAGNAVAAAQSALQDQPHQTLPASACDRISQLAPPHTRVVSAATVPAGTFAGPPAVVTGLTLDAFYKGLPSFCRVVARSQPTSDSDIGIEVWLPMSGWNGKLRGVGNGGFGGQIDYQHLGMAVTFGYAAAATDTGHTGSPIDASWALGHPEKVIDFGHRAIHEMTVVAKAVTRALYGTPPKRAYFTGCSDGGREALMAAQRYPEDFDGILAGAPANDWTRLLTMAIVDSQALLSDDASFIGPGKIPAIASAVVSACDQQDGVRDGIVANPVRCRFDPASLLCGDGQSSDACLSATQVSVLRHVYDGLRDARGATIFPGYSPGTEEGPGGWGTWITGPAPGKSLMFAFGFGYFANMVFEKADWDYRTFDAENALRLAEQKTGAALNATDPDLGPFMKRGGKLILYHGWGDAAIPPLNTIRYYDSVVTALGQSRTDTFVRLFMVPGMQHCAGGPGAHWLGQNGSMLPPDPLYNANVALERWVESGVAPSTILASVRDDAAPSEKPRITRLLCPHPLVATYKGSGDMHDAANYECAPDKH